MLRFLRSVLKPGSPAPASVPAKRLDITLAKIEGALIEEKQYPRPQWKLIHAWVKEHVPAEDLQIAWQEISFDWVSTLQKDLGCNYAVYQSPNFLLLTSRGNDAGKAILRTSELAVQFLVKWLGPVAEKRGHGKHVVLDFDSIENYYDYVSYFYATESEVRASGGVFLRRGYQHIALPPSRHMQDTLIHELAHNRLSHLPLPAWLNEGIAVTMERKIGGNKHGRLDRELLKKHQDYWSSETIAAFWSGDSFDDHDGEVVGLSYSLADNLVDLAVQEFSNFGELVHLASREDAGESAAQKCFGISLNDLVATFLGPGDWQPKVSA
jgi:hypothetical protein